MSRQLISYVGLVVLFALSFLVLHRIYGYVIVIQSESNDCFFMFGRQFLMGFFDRPGAPLCYAGRFLGQFYYHTWLGALVVCLCVASFGVLFHRVLSKRKTNVHVSLTLIPCFLLLVLHTSTIWLVQDTLGLCASCGAFLGYLSFRGKVSRRVSALVATPIIYLLLGVYALFFVAWVVIFELNDKPLRSGLLFGIAYVVFCIAVPLIAWRWVFPMPLLSALLWPVTFIWPSRGGLLHCSTANIVMDCVLAIMFCASVFLIPYCGRLPWKPPVPSRWRARARRWQRVGPAIAFVILVILLHSIRYDTRLSTLVTCRQLYKNEQWDALLAEVKKCPSTSVDLQFMTNFALCKKRRLLDEMFHYPQMWGTRGLVLNFSTLGELKPADDDIYRAMYNSDLFFEMGHINLAFRHAYDRISAEGETYDALKRMAQCSMVNGNYAMAAKYLNILERTLFHSEFARRYKAIIADPVAADKEFRDIRKRLPVVDVSMRQHPFFHISALLTNKDNRVAFDYVTAWLLLTKTKESLFTIAQNVDQFNRTGYASIPTHCQEVLLLWEKQEGTTIDLLGFGYDQATTVRVNEFLQDLPRYGAGKDAAHRMQTRYGDTYMFFCYFVPTPAELRQRMAAGIGSGTMLRQE
ncbi:MAG: hypothetical protein ISR77_17930 [Pirellulaceae bacterium]|nr:hypothetical protein [Pirellulaceae bacterium]